MVQGAEEWLKTHLTLLRQLRIPVDLTQTNITIATSGHNSDLSDERMSDIKFAFPVPDTLSSSSSSSAAPSLVSLADLAQAVQAGEAIVVEFAEIRYGLLLTVYTMYVCTMTIYSYCLLFVFISLQSCPGATQADSILDPSGTPPTPSSFHYTLYTPPLYLPIHLFLYTHPLTLAYTSLLHPSFTPYPTILI